MNIAMMSMFMNEGDDLESKVNHLLSKERGNHRVRFIWVIGKTSKPDNTLVRLLLLKTMHQLRTGIKSCVSTVSADSPIADDTTDIRERLRRLSDHARAGLECLRTTDDYLLIHESDLVSPSNVIDQLVNLSTEMDFATVAGWPTLTLGRNSKVFYDIWAYRKNGEHFRGSAPYCEGFNGKVIEVDSVGSVWCAPAKYFLESKTAWPHTEACVEMCNGIRSLGGKIYVDPEMEIIQPKSRWVQW